MEGRVPGWVFMCVHVVCVCVCVCVCACMRVWKGGEQYLMVVTCVDLSVEFLSHELTARDLYKVSLASYLGPSSCLQ